MPQSTFIAAALIAGFVLFLAGRGRLSTYAAVLWGSTTVPVPPTSTQGPSASPGAAAVKAGGNLVGASSISSWLPDLALIAA